MCRERERERLKINKRKHTNRTTHNTIPLASLRATNGLRPWRRGPSPWEQTNAPLSRCHPDRLTMKSNNDTLFFENASRVFERPTKGDGRHFRVVDF